MQLTRQEILTKLKEVLLFVDSSKADLINAADESTSLSEDLGLTSVGMLFTVISIEESFNIVFGDIGMDELHTVGDVIDYIGEKL